MVLRYFGNNNLRSIDFKLKLEWSGVRLFHKKYFYRTNQRILTAIANVHEPNRAVPCLIVTCVL